VADVKKAFAAEGAFLRSPFHEHAGMPVTLIPENAGSALFSATVYDAGSVSRPLGLRVSNAGYLVVRVRNVVISYPPSADVTAQVQAAVGRLRNAGTSRSRSS